MEFDTLKKKLLSGSLASMLRVSLAIPAYMVTTPFVLNHLGAELFGLWSLATLIMSLMALTDFGFKNTLVSQVAGNLSDKTHINEHFNMTFLAYLIISLVVIVITLLFGEGFARSVLRIHPTHLTEAHFLLVVTAFGFGLRFVSMAFQAVEEGHQEHAPVQVILLLWLALHFGGTIIALTIRPDIYALGIAAIIPNGAVLMAFSWRKSKYYPDLRIAPRHLKMKALKDMMRQGTGIQAATLLTAAREPVYKILIARSTDLSSLATFDIVFRLSTQLASLVIAPLSGSFSASALLAKDKTDDFGKIIRPMFGFGLAIFVPAVLFIAAFAKILINLWLGPGFPNVAPMLTIGFAAFAAYYCTEVLYKAIEGSGLTGYSGLVQLATSILCIGSFALFVGDSNITAPMSLLFGFSVFSIINFGMFRWRFPTILLCAWNQWLWLIVPAIVFLALFTETNEPLRPWLFLFYISVHIYGCRRSRLFDFIDFGLKIARVIHSTR